MSKGNFSVWGAVVVALLVASAILGIVVGYGIGTSVSPAKAASATTITSTATVAATTPYVLTLVITTGNEFSPAIGYQPAYYVLGPNGGLKSSAQISLPANQSIKLVIIDYDNGAANLTESKYASVTGVVGSHVTWVNNTLVNSTMGSSGIQIRGVDNVTSLPASEIAHTFTIPALGINIPVAPLSTEVAYFTIAKAGTYSWFCMTECGSGVNGLMGAMATTGWMTGSVTAH